MNQINPNSKQLLPNEIDMSPGSCNSPTVPSHHTKHSAPAALALTAQLACPVTKLTVAHGHDSVPSTTTRRPFSSRLLPRKKTTDGTIADPIITSQHTTTARFDTCCTSTPPAPMPRSCFDLPLHPPHAPRLRNEFPTFLPPSRRTSR